MQKSPKSQPKSGESSTVSQTEKPKRRKPRGARHEKLTNATIAKMTYAYAVDSNEKDFRWDEEVANFGVRVYPSGKKSFVIGYRHKGDRRVMVLAGCDEMTYKEAKEFAQDKFSEIRKDKKDPRLEKQRALRGEKIATLCLEYMERYAKVEKKSWIDDERRINRYILPKWGSRRIDSVTQAEVSKLHHEIGVGKGGKKGARYQANRIRELLATMFNKAKEWGLLEKTAENPAQGITDFKEIKRDRWVTHEELPRLAQAIEAEKNLYARAALWMYLFTGARRSELLNAKWADVDSVREELRLVDTKNGKTHYLPLSKPAVALLESLPKESKNPYIFPGLKTGAHLVNIDKPWRRVREKAEVEDVRLHDLRRTVGSWLAQDGNTLHLVGRVLNHSSQATTAIYARFAQDNLRAALEKHSGNILEHAGSAAPKMVTRTRKTRRKK